MLRQLVWRRRTTHQVIKRWQSSSKTTDLQREFHEKLEFAKSLPELDDNQTKLQMYAFFKQATVGPCTSDTKPGMFDMVGKFKWNAWNQLGNMSSDQAMLEYMAIIDTLSASSQPPSSHSSPVSTEDLHIFRTNNDKILSIELNRADKFNALNWNMYTTIQDTLNQAKEDDTVHAVVFRSTGPFFCSGNDLSMFQNIPSGGPKELAANGSKVLEGFVDAFISFPKPIVAVVQGPAIGISVTILALCDLVFASEKATFQTPFATLGQSPEACSSLLFSTIFGPAKANAMLFLGKKLSAQEAYHDGLVSETFSTDFQEQVQTRITQLAEMPPKALKQSKQLIRSHSIEQLREINRKECQLLEELWVADECLNAIMAFSNRRK